MATRKAQADPLDAVAEATLHITRKFVRIWAEENNEDYTYGFVIFIFLISTIFSWASFMVIGICLIIALLGDKEPPNWL